MNYHRGSFLDDGFSDVMKDWGVDKFDVVVGNPPYNDGGKRHFYVKFFERSFELINNVGYFTFITPSRYVIQPEFEKLRNKIKKISNYCYLKNTGRSFGDSVSFTTVITTLHIDKNKQNILNINWYKGIGDSIVEKVLNNDLKRLYTIRSKAIIKNKEERDSYPAEKNDVFKWKYFVNSKGNKNTPFRFLDKKIPDTFKSKIVTTEFVGTNKKKTLGKPLIDYDGDWGLATDSSMVVYNNDKNILDKLYSYFTSNLMNYIITNICQSSHVNQTMRLLPDVTYYMEKVTNEELYRYFNLTDEEIKLIEDIRKKERKFF